MVIGEKSPDIFFVYTLEVRSDLRGKGVGAAFEEHFDQLAKQLGFKFHASHQNDAETARYFLQHGRYLLAEIRDDKKEEFRPMRDPDDEEVYQTIKFLNPEDVNEYVRPERIGTDVEDKIRYMESQIANFREK